MDIKDFFPSIKINREMSVFRVLCYTKKISYYLASICCLDGVLPQGAATSPSLSNIIAKRLDYRLNGFAKKFNLTYTRYADDFTFSGFLSGRSHSSILKEPIICINKGLNVLNNSASVKPMTNILLLFSTKYVSIASPTSGKS